ncbi:MAG: hypothetical protein ACK41S_09665 [Planctomycetota bacterium]
MLRRHVVIFARHMGCRSPSDDPRFPRWNDDPKPPLGAIDDRQYEISRVMVQDADTTRLQD